MKGAKTGGRTKGTPNKVTGAVKGMVLEALRRKGGTKWLEEQADKNPAAFMTLIGKCIPHELTGEGGAPIQAKVTVEFVSKAA